MNDTVYRMNIPVSLALLGDMHGKPYQTVTNSLRKHHPEIITVQRQRDYQFAQGFSHGCSPPEAFVWLDN